MADESERRRRRTADPEPARRGWEPMELRRLGTLGELVGGGGGKLSPMGDPGDGRKPRGQG